MKAVNSKTSRELAAALSVADTLPRRMIGLLGRSSLACDEGLWIKPCNSIHTFCMKFPIDVIFLTKEHTVLEVKRQVPPNSLTRIYLKAASVIELPAGKIDETATQIGDMVTIL